ncbi:acyl-CoA dehydrogenase family protein, partial [Saccharomonospora iraqiensis]|uniref:acyl-CoA dehydrogenase family protein n=1 Tax=Saccharomonospora iraqiensis TaxID=52698 RepID=UPI00022DEDB5
MSTPGAFAPTEEQQALAETVRALLERTPAERAWSLLCGQVGVAGLAVPEEYGGVGATPAEVAVVAHELGRELTPAPLLGSTVLATHALLASGDGAACARLLPSLAEGTGTAALAWTGTDGRWDPDTAACTAVAGADGGTVSGTAHYVLDGDTADTLLVVARGDTGSGEAGDLGLFEVDPAATGVTRTHTPTMDTTRRLAVLTLDAAPARRIGTGDFRPALHRVRDLACAVLATEQAGTAERALELTVAYTREREQFGRPIGGF